MHNSQSQMQFKLFIYLNVFNLLARFTLCIFMLFYEMEVLV
jgi:hypothetical protein